VVTPLALGVVPPAYLYVFIIAKNWRRGKTIRSRRAFFSGRVKIRRREIFSVSAFNGLVPLTLGRRLWLWDNFQACIIGLIACSNRGASI